MKRIVIFANGEAGDLDAIRSLISGDDEVICADGGAVHAYHAGITPHAIIGDLDSLDEHPEVRAELEARGVRLCRFPADKDFTDLELALDYARDQNAEAVLIVCAFGGRIDHQLENILLCTLPKYRSIAMTLSDGRQEAVLLHGPAAHQMTGKAGEVFSLIPLSPEVTNISVEGARWPLARAQLQFGGSLSISNTIQGDAIVVSLEAGSVLLTHEASRP